MSKSRKKKKKQTQAANRNRLSQPIVESKTQEDEKEPLEEKAANVSDSEENKETEVPVEEVLEKELEASEEKASAAEERDEKEPLEEKTADVSDSEEKKETEVPVEEVLEKELEAPEEKASAAEETETLDETQQDKNLLIETKEQPKESDNKLDLQKGIEYLQHQWNTLAPKAVEALKKIQPRYWVLGGAGVGAILAAVLLVGIFCFEWWGLVPKQRPVVGTWSIQQENAVMYLTLSEDGTAVTTIEGKSVKGTYNLLENDRILFHISTQDLDAWSGEYSYWATDEDLTLTLLPEEEEPASPSQTDSEETVLLFQKEEKDVTVPEPPETVQIDPELIGSWSDVSDIFIYEFREDGTLTIDCLGVYSNCTYEAKDGVLKITTLVDGQPQVESNEYSIEEDLLSFSNMELIKNE